MKRFVKRMSIPPDIFSKILARIYAFRRLTHAALFAASPGLD
jgi:hypothetical protein